MNFQDKESDWCLQPHNREIPSGMRWHERLEKLRVIIVHLVDYVEKTGFQVHCNNRFFVDPETSHLFMKHAIEVEKHRNKVRNCDI